ncbi:MAG: hypothetical protein JWM47_3357 [Acidimicrobiales bacterium]|nr:hypothetical protein [Acidimicrobiales bacterium]
MVVFGVLDLSRIAQLQNRLSSAARSGAAVAQFYPKGVDTGCAQSSVVDAAKGSETKLSALSGFTVTVSKRNAATGALTPYTGCGAASGGVTLAAGDEVVVTVTAKITMFTPLASAFVGSPLSVQRSVDVVVQG